MKRQHVPIRTCRSCGKKAAKNELNRFVLENGTLVEGSKNGFGFYCCPETDCRAKIEKKLRKQKIVRAERKKDGSN